MKQPNELVRYLNAATPGDIAFQLRTDADEMEACGAGNEAAGMRRAAKMIGTQQDQITALTAERDEWKRRAEGAADVCRCSGPARAERMARAMGCTFVPKEPK